MRDALVVGGTRYIGRHAVEELLAHDYRVTLFNRGNHENPFAGDDRVDHVEGDRTDDRALVAAATQVAPDVVIDVVAYYPRDVRQATAVFEDVVDRVDADLPLDGGVGRVLVVGFGPVGVGAHVGSGVVGHCSG